MINTSDHLAELLYRQLKLPTAIIETTGTGKPSTSESALSTLARVVEERSKEKVILDNYAKWKKNLKLLTTYTGGKKGLLSRVEDGRVYAEYLQSGRGKEGTKGGTVTGRLSSRNPNMQNLPRDGEVKKFFIPDPGHVFIYFDYSQLELRLAAHLSQDENLLRAYREGLDLHQLTADGIGLPRQIGKTTNFAMIYDASAWRLAQILGRDMSQCEHIIGSFFDLYKGYKSYLYAQRRFMKQYGVVVSETGRARRLPDVLHFSWKDREFKHALKQGYNFPIQSLGASITKRCMVELANQGYDLVTQVHDSVIIQVKSGDTLGSIEAAQEHIKQVAENIYPISVPLKIDMKILTSLSESDTINKEE